MLAKLKSKYPSWFSTQGRIGRTKFFFFFLGINFVGFVALALWVNLVLFLRSFLPDWVIWPDPPEIVFLLNTLLDIAFALWPLIIAALLLSVQWVKRAHDYDLDLSLRLAIILNLIPIVNFIGSFWLWIGRPTVGPNKFGEDPIIAYRAANEKEYKSDSKE